MRMTMKKLTQGATRLLVLALGLGLVSTGWAAVPTVAWDGDFGTTEKTGSDGVTYTFAAGTGNSVENGKLVIGSGSGYGGAITWPLDTTKGVVSVLVKYSSLDTTDQGTPVLAAVTAMQCNDDGTPRTTIIDDCVGVKEANGSKLTGRWNNNSSAYGGEVADIKSPSGYILMVYTAGAAFQFWTSRDGLTWSGGTASSLLFSYTYAQGVGLGGMSGSASNSGYGRTAGMTIEAVAIYRDVALNAVKARNCHFDSEYTTQDYKKWAYANAALTFSSASNADIGSGSTPLKSFSIATGTDGSDTYYGGGNVGYFGTTFWHNYCCNQTAYSAPGCVLRVTSAVAVGAGFSYSQGPLTLGGLIIESSADGCSFGGDAQSTVLGSASESCETWFGINGNASINRNGFMFISGTVNIDVAEGKSFSLNASQSTAAYYPTIKGSVTTANTATGAGTDGGVLRMHGLGTITVPTLIASNEATLDFSDVQENGTVVRSTTPFIQGNLTVDATTKLVFPAGLAEGAAYKICSGTLTAPAKTVQTSVQVGTGDAFTAYVTYNASDKTVSYSSSAPTYTGTVSGSTITWDVTPTVEDLADGNVVLTGSGEVTLAAEPISINAGSGVTVDITGYENAVFSGTGTFKFRSGYRTHVPSGMTYQYAGSNDTANPKVIAGVTVDGTLKTSGYVNLTSLVIDAAGTLDVLSESSTVSTTTRSNGAGNLSGTIIIRSGATMVNATVDGLDWGGTTLVDIYGTLAMEGTRWSVRQFANCVINLYPGAQVTGAGDGNGVLDLFDATSKLNMYAGTSGGTATISGPVRLRNSGVKYPIWIASGATLELSGGTLGSGGFSMNGAGELKLSGAMGHSGDSLVQDGTVTLDNIATAIPITVNGGKTLAVIATEVETTVPINATIAATSSIISSSGSGKVSGNIGFSSYSASQLTSVASGTLGAFLTGSSWTGTVTVPAHDTTSTERVFLANLGNSNSTIALNGLSGSTHWIGGGTFPAELKIVGDVTFNNGGSGMNAVIGKVSGTDSTKTLTVAAWANCTGGTYTINDLSEFEGAISVDGSSLSSGTFKLAIGNITKASYSYGLPLVTCSTTPGTYGTTTIDISNTTLNNSAANLVFDADGIYLAEAAYSGTNYKSLSTAISVAEAASADPGSVTVYNSSATIPSGYALVTAAGGAMTLRSAGSGELIYWADSNSGDWSGEDSNGTHTFYTSEGGTSTTPYVTGDTVVFTSDIQIWSKTAAHGAKFQVGTDSQAAEVHFTRSGDHCDDYILDGSMIEIKSGSTLVAERYGDTDPATQAYTAWDSYSSHSGSEIKDTAITGAGTFKVGGDTGGHGAASAVLSGTTAISCVIDLADGATLIVPSGCTVTAPTTSVTDKMVTYSTDSGTGTKTYSVVPTVAKLVNGVDETPYADIMTAIGNLISTLNANPAAYVQVLDSTAELANAYGGHGVGLDATTRRYAKAVAISGEAGFITVQAAIDAVASEGSITLKADCGDALTLADGKTVTIVAKPGNVTYTYTLPTAVTPASYMVIAGETVDGTTTFTSMAFYTVTISAGVEHASATVNGSPVASGASVQVVAGTNVEIVWTPDSGYKITDGATQTINSIAANTTADTPTVEAMGATVSDVSVSYGADYASATVTATISDTTLDYYISWSSGEPVKGSVSGSQVTFDVSGINHTTEYQSAGYTITAKDGETVVQTTGGSGTSVAADTTAWFSQSSANSGAPVGGSWATAVNLSTPTNVTDNTFEATAPSTSSRVVLEFEVCFSSTSEEDVSGEAQAAIKLAEVNSVTTFMVLTNGNNWAAVSNAELTPDASATYKVVLTIDYGSNAYGVTVGNYVLTNSAGSASFPLAANRTSVQNIDFAGSGTLTSLKGDQFEGYMVVDNNGTRYPSIAAAISAYTQDPSIGPLRVLHDGTPPSGWKIDEATKNLIKVAKGLFFMAY